MIFLQTNNVTFSERHWDWFVDTARDLGLKIVTGLVIIFIGFWLTTRIRNIISRRMVTRNVDPTIRTFILPIFNVLLKIMVVLAAINTMGVQITSFLTILGGMGVAIGLAMQGSLSNFAAGLLLIIFKPFKLGDIITSGAFTGTVEGISILYTTLVTDENNVVVLPNGSLFNNPIVNSSVKTFNRLDIEFEVPFNDNLETTKKQLLELLINDKQVKNNLPVSVDTEGFDGTNVKIAMRGYVDKSDYWDAHLNLHHQAKAIIENKK